MNKEDKDKFIALKYALEQELSKKGIQSRVDISQGQCSTQQRDVINVNLYTTEGNHPFIVWRPHKEDSQWYWESAKLVVIQGEM